MTEASAILNEQLLNLEDFLVPEILNCLFPEPLATIPAPPSDPSPTCTPTQQPLPHFDKEILLQGFVSPDILRSCLLTESLPTVQPASEDSEVTPTTPSSSRFGIISNEELQAVWLEWCQCRNISESILDIEERQINELMAQFVQEVRRKDGKEYPPGSITSIVSAVQRFLRENGRPAVSFYDEKNDIYDLLRKSMDAKLKELTRKGIGCYKKHAQPVTQAMEQELWEKKIFGTETAQALTNVVFWYSSKMYGLRAADEHRQLDVSQFSIGSNENGKYLRFMGRNCKNWQGGLHQRKIEPKDLKIYAKPELEERCAVSIFEMYLNLIPPEGPFYRRPLPGSPAKYSIQVIGVNKLSIIVKTFCGKAGFEGYYTNHSGKVTCATELFNNNIDEQLIMKQTGHRSQDAVRKYKRPSAQHEKQVSDILQPPAPKRYNTSESLDILSEKKAPASSSTSNMPVFNFSVQGSATQNIYINYDQ